MEKISCIITTRNRLELLQRAVKSVLEQDYDNKELIIVDDGSNDGTKEWCESLKDENPSKVKYLRIPKEDSKGGNYARNLGIKASSGNFIAFLDDDDEWLQAKLSSQVSMMNANNECVVVYGGAINEIIDKEGKIHYKEVSVNKYYTGDVSKKILTSIFTTTSVLMVRREALFEVGLFDENLKFWQEYELSIRLAQLGTFLATEKPLINYRVNIFDANRLTNKYYAWKEAVKYIRNKHKNLYKQLTLFEKFKAKALVWRDAVMRTQACGMSVKSKYYRGLFFSYKIVFIIKEGSLFRRIKKKLIK